jgi:RNA polymerase sigma factor (TIGR02999 family)
MSEVTLLLEAVSRGEAHASEELLPLVYEELRHLAAARMAQEASGQTLQPTALVHEAWLRLVGGGNQTWQNRAHFFGAAAEAMRRILIERARRKARLKRGGGQVPLNLDDFEIVATTPDERVLMVEDALQQLESQDPKLARVVTLKFFGGLTNAEVGEVLGVTERTVLNHWAFARAWLLRQIAEQQRQ